MCVVFYSKTTRTLKRQAKRMIAQAIRQLIIFIQIKNNVLQSYD